MYMSSAAVSSVCIYIHPGTLAAKSRAFVRRSDFADGSPAHGLLFATLSALDTFVVVVAICCCGLQPLLLFWVKTRKRYLSYGDVSCNVSSSSPPSPCPFHTQKLILSEKARTKHSDGGGGGAGERRVDGGDVSDDDEGEGDTRDRGGGDRGGGGRAGGAGAKEKKQKGT